MNKPKYKFFRDLQNGIQVVIKGEVCVKVRPKLAMTKEGNLIQVADNVQVQLHEGNLAA